MFALTLLALVLTVRAECDSAAPSLVTDISSVVARSSGRLLADRLGALSKGIIFDDLGSSVLQRMVDQDPAAKPLVDFMTSQLQDLQVIVIGADDYDHDAEHPVFIVGTAPDGTVVGFRSTVVWT